FTGLPAIQLSPDKQSVFLSGIQYSDEPEKKAPRPYIDKVTIKSGKKTRIFQSSADYYEQVVAALDDHINDVVMTRESSNTIPDAWLLQLETGNKTRLTSNTNYNKPIS